LGVDLDEDAAAKWEKKATAWVRETALMRRMTGGQPLLLRQEKMAKDKEKMNPRSAITEDLNDDNI